MNVEKDGPSRTHCNYTVEIEMWDLVQVLGTRSSHTTAKSWSIICASMKSSSGEKLLRLKQLTTLSFKSCHRNREFPCSISWVFLAQVCELGWMRVFLCAIKMHQMTLIIAGAHLLVPPCLKLPVKLEAMSAGTAGMSNYNGQYKTMKFPQCTIPS